MSGAVTAIAVATVAATAYTIYSGEENRKAQGEANKQAERAAQDARDNAKKTQQMQEQEINRANAKKPDVAAMLSGNEQAAKGGAGSTMLTGPQGVDPNALNLGKNTLLGS